MDSFFFYCIEQHWKSVFFIFGCLHLQHQPHQSEEKRGRCGRSSPSMAPAGSEIQTKGEDMVRPLYPDTSMNDIRRGRFVSQLLLLSRFHTFPVIPHLPSRCPQCVPTIPSHLVCPLADIQFN